MMKDNHKKEENGKQRKMFNVLLLFALISLRFFDLLPNAFLAHAVQLPGK